MRHSPKAPPHLEEAVTNHVVKFAAAVDENGLKRFRVVDRHCLHPLVALMRQLAAIFQRRKGQKFAECFYCEFYPKCDADADAVSMLELCAFVMNA